MVKPQFEVGKERLGKGGVVRDPALRGEAVAAVADAAAARGWGAVAVARSPLPGPSGNVEFFLWLRHGPASLADADVADAVGSVTPASTGDPGAQGGLEPASPPTHATEPPLSAPDERVGP